MGATASEGAAGTIYEVYAKNIEDLKKATTDEAYSYLLIQFKFRNENFKKGQIVGTVSINGTEVSLVAK